MEAGWRKDLTIKALAALRNPGKHRVSRNLYLQIEGRSRSWLFRYERHGVAHWHGLGSCDLVSLADARDRALDCRRMLRAGTDPIEHGRAQKVQTALVAASTMTFRECAAAYFNAHAASWRSSKHQAQWQSSLETYVYPVIGELPVASIDTGLIMRIIDPLWQAKPETADRVRGRIDAVLDWATARGYRHGPNPARWRGHLDQLLPKKAKLHRVQHMAAMPYAEVPAFMAQLQARTEIAAKALEFAILTAARTAETLGAQWSEIDLNARLWIVPAERIKGGREHRVPLPDRAIAILQSLPREPGNLRVFPSARQGKPLAEVAMLRVLRAMGVPCTTHGFRSSFRDWAAEVTAYPRELAEVALAHAPKDKTEAAYQRGDLLEKRRRLMDAWARYVLTPPRQDVVVPLARRS
jgi:integrase